MNKINFKRHNRPNKSNNNNNINTHNKFKRIFPKLKKYDQKAQSIQNRRFLFIFFLSMIFFFLIGARLFYLQVVNYKQYKKKAENNRFRTIRLKPIRGAILDRFGRALAIARPSFNLVFYREGPNKEQIKVLSKVSQLIGVDLPLLQTKVIDAEKQRIPKYIPVTLLRDLDWNRLSRIAASIHKLSSIDIEIEPLRRYPQGLIASHLIGYIDEVSFKEIKNGSLPWARPGDLVGKSGVELAYEHALKGIAGIKQVEIDATGRLVRIIDTIPPVKGDDLFLTIDSQLQKAALNAMGKEAGAVVAIEPNSGRLLCMISTPGFDPSVFAGTLSAELWKRLRHPLYNPLLNRAIQGAYPPGSIFKIIMAIGALQDNYVSYDNSFFCSGSFKLGRKRFRCWRRGGHGNTNLYKSLVESCDVYFYQVGLLMGIKEIAKWARRFGLGEKTGIELQGERSALVPTKKWKLIRQKTPWQKGETLITSIGQGALTVTPIQAANMMATVANGGTRYIPSYIEELRGPDGEVKKRFKPVIKSKIKISPFHLELVNRALIGVTEEKHGTGKLCRIKGVHIAGKTGTAQVIKQEKRVHSKKLEWKNRDHAWFVAYAPAENPEIAIAVLVEHGGHGGNAAAPIAQKVLQTWFWMKSPMPSSTQGRAL